MIRLGLARNSLLPSFLSPFGRSRDGEGRELVSLQTSERSHNSLQPAIPSATDWRSNFLLLSSPT